MRGRPGFVTWAGLAVVFAAAAMLSFSALAELAKMVGVPPGLAWLLPICTDAGVAVSTAVWLSRRHHPDAERFARRLTWALLALTVAGNAAHQGLTAAGVVPPWWVAVLVGAIPPSVVGAVVHVAVLVGRGGESQEREPLHVETGDNDPIDRPATVPAWKDRAAELIAAGAGRRKLAAELEISEHQARALLSEYRARGS
jgi:Protein of unknown function (DUF2637)